MVGDSNKKWVVFIDCLDEDDLSRTDFMRGNVQGTMEATPPRVTPRVMSSIYTGLDPAENGMMRSQRAGVQDASRPHQTTVMERAMANGYDVLSLYMPFATPMNVHQGSAMIGGDFNGGMAGAPQYLVSKMDIPGPTGDLIGDQRHDIVFDHFVDYTAQTFATARSLAPDFDVIFIGFRLIDSYCHFQYDTNENGRGAGQGDRYRDKLAEAVDLQLQQLVPRGDVLFFSDHGATDLDDTFRINQWLRDEGLLEYEIDEDFIEQAQEYGMLGGEQHPVEARVENQTIVGQPGVRLDTEASQVICADPFDSCLTWLGENDEEAIRDVVNEVADHDLIRDAYHKSELFDTDGRFFDVTPDIIPDRDEGVFVSGNVHPDPIGMGWYRTGVHTKYGVYGSNTDVGAGTVTPEGMNRVIEDFLDLDRDVNPAPEAISRLSPQEREFLKHNL